MHTSVARHTAATPNHQTAGPGPIGILCAAMARLAGAQVALVGLERDRVRLEVAKVYGCDVIVGDASAWAKERDGLGVDGVIDAAGASAASTLADLGYKVKNFVFHDSPRRAHSIAAQGGINAAKNYQNDGDSVHRLFYDTIKGGDFRAREANVHRLAEVLGFVKLVMHDVRLRYELLGSIHVCGPHVHGHRFNGHPLT